MIIILVRLLIINEKSNFYLLYSGDKSLLSNEVNKLKKNLNITSDSIYYDIENVSDIVVEASTIGMFDPYKFIVIDSGSYFYRRVNLIFLC